jgi:hypothetical protein
MVPTLHLYPNTPAGFAKLAGSSAAAQASTKNAHLEHNFLFDYGVTQQHSLGLTAPPQTTDRVEGT